MNNELRLHSRFISDWMKTLRGNQCYDSIRMKVEDGYQFWGIKKVHLFLYDFEYCISAGEVLDTDKDEFYVMELRIKDLND